jgi:general stress protein 26
MSDNEIFEKMNAVMDSQEMCFMATVNAAGYPETRAMLNLHNKALFPSLQKYFEDNVVYLASNSNSAKIAHIRKDNKISLYYVNPATYEGVLLVGTVEMVKDMVLKRAFWQDNWLKLYRGGVDDPSYALLKFSPLEYKYFDGRGKVIPGNI